MKGTARLRRIESSVGHGKKPCSSTKTIILHCNILLSVVCVFCPLWPLQLNFCGCAAFGFKAAGFCRFSPVFSRRCGGREASEERRDSAWHRQRSNSACRESDNCSGQAGCPEEKASRPQARQAGAAAA